MPRTIRFHLDENCHPAVAGGLRRRGVDATTSHDAGLLGASDDEQLRHAFSQGRVIFTQDRGFLRLSGIGTPHAGITYCAKDTLSIGEIIQGLVLIWELLEPHEMTNRVEYL